MGISANQARLLALTGRKCDLETQMQMILNNKVNIAKETSRIADDYNDSISNRRLFIFKPQTDVLASVYQDLSAKNIYNTGGLLIVEKTGTSYTQLTVGDSALIEKGLRDGTFFLVKKADDKTQDPKTVTFQENYMGSGIHYGGGDVLPDNTILTQDCEIIDWRTNTNIMDELDKSDDESAQQNYERLMKEIELKEAKLDVEMNSIQTSHSAISNELEATKKILTKNTEEAFKYFS